MIGSEAVPFAKTGGLGDVLGALPLALGRLGWPVTLAIPRYRGISGGDPIDRLQIDLGGYVRDVVLRRAPATGDVEILMIDCPDLFDRDGLYGTDGHDYPDNPRRFGMLARAALEFMAQQGSRPSLVHAHDWQAGLAPVYLKTQFASHPVLGGTPVVFTIHNLAYQGVFDADWLPRLGLPSHLLHVDALEYWGRVSLLKGGINYADCLTTVSPQYALEIQTPAFGFGFEGIVHRRSADLVGILNGVDTDTWDPARDRFLTTPFSVKDLTGKAAAKQDILARYHLPVDAATQARPLIAMISRMVDQKGFDLLASIVDEIPRLDATWVVLGTGEVRYQNMWTSLAARYPDRIGARIGFSEELAHRIEAGADMFLMPSRFEPCGLNQMYSLRYGTVPIVHAVGGLLDTVQDCTPETGNSTGFVFREYTATALVAVLRRALAAFSDRRGWRALQAAGMQQDNSWDRSAREYVKIYERACRRGLEAEGPHGLADSGTVGEARGAGVGPRQA